MKAILITALLLLTGTALADGAYPSSSIYQLPARLTNQAEVEHGLDIYKGHPVLVTMFYGSCAHTCPLLIETVRAVERAAPDAKNLRVLMISIDPDSGEPSGAILRKVSRAHDGMAGVYGAVLVEGTVRRGDDVELLS